MYLGIRGPTLEPMVSAVNAVMKICMPPCNEDQGEGPLNVVIRQHMAILQLPSDDN